MADRRTRAPLPDRVIDALVAARDYLMSATESEPIYGYYPGGDPRDFHPDEECCTAEEIAAWKAACEAWSRGERPDPGGPHQPLTEESLAELQPEAACFLRAKAEDGTLRGHITVAHYGMGTYVIRDEEAEAAYKKVDAILEEWK